MNPQQYPVLYRIDHKLEVLCPDLLSASTYYVEAGANDCYTQSNTYFLEKVYGARGRASALMHSIGLPTAAERICLCHSTFTPPQVVG